MRPPPRKLLAAATHLALLAPALWADVGAPQTTEEKIADVRQAAADLRRVNWQALGDASPSNLPAAIASTLAVRLPEAAPKATAEPTTRPAAPATQPDEKPPAPATQPSDGPALQQLKELAAKGAADPLFLADALFSADRQADAEGFYQVAMNASPQGSARSWILFQIANCRRKSDPPGAKAIYQQLQKEHPDCPYAAVAAAQEKLIDWQQEKALAGLLKKAAEATCEPVVPGRSP